MRKSAFLLASAISLILGIDSAYAIPKIDFGGTAKEIVTSVSNFLDNAKKQLDNSAAIQRVIKMGKGAIETAKQLEEMKKKVEEQVAAFEEDPLNAGLNLAQDQLDKASGLNKGEEANWADKISSKMQDAQSMLDLEAQKEKLENEINEKMQGQKTELEGKIKVLEENNKNLAAEIEKNPDKKEEYEKQIAANNLKIEGYNKAVSALGQEFSLENAAGTAAELADVNSQLNKLQSAATNYAKEQAAKVQQELEEQLKSMTPEQDLKEITSKNFLAAGEPENTANIMSKKQYRKKEAGDTAIEVAARTAKLQDELPDLVDYTQKVAARTDTADGTISANTTDSQVSAEQVKALAKFIEVTIYDLKLKTSQEIAAYQGASSEPDSNITSFTLDKYICEPSNTSEGGK